MFPGIQLLDSSGQVVATPPKKERVPATRQQIISYYQNKLRMTQQQMLKAKFDAAQTFTGNVDHWANADHFDPHAVASLNVRRVLRSRSRYEIIENNPYLKGTVLTLANDFVGSGPKLQITDKSVPKSTKQKIERDWQAWFRTRRIRQKIWRMRMHKIVDGEGFMRAYKNTDGRLPVTLDFQVIECDRVSSNDYRFDKQGNIGEVDGLRFDQYENILQYHILHRHPGTNFLDRFASSSALSTGGGEGDWIDARFVIHWFRQDRGWLRGIPEITPSLPLCAILRRYTLAIARHAETAASITALIETQGPPTAQHFLDPETGEITEDDPFEVFPMEIGMIMNLPWGYTVKQLEAVPLGVQYDAFTGSLLREITRPLLCTYNLAAGTSKDSNMASGILDDNIYKGGQNAERLECEEVVLDHMFELWWAEYRLGSDTAQLRKSSNFRSIKIPEHSWRWDKIGLDHTDPSKVASGIQILHELKLMTDRDYQERYMNRSLEDWQEEVKQDDQFRMSLPSEKAALDIEKKKAEKPAAGPGKPKSAAAVERRRHLLNGHSNGVPRHSLTGPLLSP